MRILIAEDEVSIAKAVKLLLERNKFTVDMVHNGRDALDYMLSSEYDGAVLDIMMPGMDGIEALRQARRRGVGTPVLFLSAKGEVEDRITGLDAGADDYLPKPFSAGELLARVKALTRRSGGCPSCSVTRGNTTLDTGSYTLSAEKTAALNNKEFQLTELFFKNPGKLFSTEALMDRVWDQDDSGGIDTVWTYIGFLRRKLREIGSDVNIKTIRGAGYVLEARD